MHAIGIDMAKDTFWAAFDDTTSRQFRNTEEGINEFTASLNVELLVRLNTTIGVEATGVYHLLLCARLKKNGWRSVVINPLITNRMITAGLRKVKTDRTDALIIRKAVLAGHGYEFTDTPDTLALKTLVTERAALVQVRAGMRQRIHAHGVRNEAASSTMHDSFSHTMKALSKDIKNIERRMSVCLPETQRLLRSIPGVGALSAAALVAFVGDIHRFSSPEKLTAYIGIDCRVHLSGTSIHGKGFITKRGNKYLRHVLFNAAFIAKRRDPGLKRYYEKKITEGKHCFAALVAVERKLIHIVWAVWKRGTPFEMRSLE